MNGERQDEDSLGGRRRTETLRMLVAMNPSQALPVRALTVRGDKTNGINEVDNFCTCWFRTYLQRRFNYFERVTIFQNVIQLFISEKVLFDRSVLLRNDFTFIWC